VALQILFQRCNAEFDAIEASLRLFSRGRGLDQCGIGSYEGTLKSCKVNLQPCGCIAYPVYRYFS
jgi:hypothetical protein